MANEQTFWNKLVKWRRRNRQATEKAGQSVTINGKKRREFVVIGMGRFGTSVAKTLHDYGHDVLAIDKRADRVQHLRNELPHIVQLDATNAEALRQLGIGQFDTGLICMSSDFESTLLTTVLLLRAGVNHVISKARTRTQMHILNELGAHQVILPEHEAGVRLGRQLAFHNFVDYLEIGDGISIVEIMAPQNLVGKTLGECDLRQKFGLTVVAVRRDHSVIPNLGADFRIRPGDELMVLGRMEDAERLEG